MSKDNDNLDFSSVDSVLDFLKKEAPSETSLKQSQVTKERYLNPAYKEQWHKKNSARLNDPEYNKKLSNSLTKWHAENPNAAKQRANKPETIAKHKQNMKELMESGKWVMPSFEGNTHTEEVRKIISETHAGRVKPLEGNKKISKYFKGKKKSASAVAKASKSLRGRKTGRTRTVITTVKTFEKLNDAAQYFDVSPESIKNWINKKGKTIRCAVTRQKLLDKGIELDANNYPIGFEWGNSINNLGPQKVHTDKGIFDTSVEAAKASSISVNGLRHRIHSDNWPDFYYLDEKSEFKSPQLTN